MNKRFIVFFLLVSPIYFISDSYAQLKVLHLSFHKGCIQDFQAVGKALNLDVTPWYILESKESHDRFDPQAPNWNEIYNVTHERAQRVWDCNKEYFNQFDVILTSDTAPLARIFLQNEWEKPLIIWICNRFDYYDWEKPQGFPDAEYYQLFDKAINKENVKVVGYVAYEHFYARQKGVNTGSLIIKPMGSVEQTFREGAQSYIPAHIIKQETFFIPPRLEQHQITQLTNKCNELGIKTYCGKYNGPADLKEFKGVIHFPYAWSNLALFENIQLGLPHFVPSQKFLKELSQSSKSHLYKFFALENLEYCEWFMPENSKAIIHFDSWNDLKNKIKQTNFSLLREQIKKFGQQHKEQVLSQWRQLFTEFENYLGKTGAKSVSNSPINKIDQYKEFLDDGTYAASCLQGLAVKPKSRHYTFKKVFEHFENTKGKVIVELGTSRSFVHGGLPGCCSSDTKYWEPHNPASWDWGAGFFTRVALECLAHLKLEFHTLDIDAEHIWRCKVMTQDFKDLIHYHVCSSEQFLSYCKPESIDLLYMDTGGIDHQTALLHLRESQIVVERNLLSKNGLMLIDDVKNFLPDDPTKRGKARYSIPYLLENGYEIVEDEYQVIMRKK